MNGLRNVCAGGYCLSFGEHSEMTLSTGRYGIADVFIFNFGPASYRHTGTACILVGTWSPRTFLRKQAIRARPSVLLVHLVFLFKQTKSFIIVFSHISLLFQ